jgi:hypothetical protein|uniref:Uncharacterized protein n=1 Tax=Mus musculus TaxID=10090 RepID=Q3TTI1_MOUSE|nr:unnamed protein product [Mus musculus]BAE36344.1 unnamed protein product [Mus musculus]
MIGPRFAIQSMTQRSPDGERVSAVMELTSFSTLQSLLPGDVIWGDPLSLNCCVLGLKVGVAAIRIT